MIHHLSIAARDRLVRISIRITEDRRRIFSFHRHGPAPAFAGAGFVRATGRGTVLERVARTKPAPAKAGAGP